MREKPITCLFLWLVFVFNKSSVFVGFPAHLASSTCYPLLEEKNDGKEAGI